MPAWRGEAAERDRAIGTRADHELGTWSIATTAMFDRLSFRAVQSVLVLYLADHLLRLPEDRVVGLAPIRAMLERITGRISNDALASQIFALFVALAFLTPLFGGMLGDRRGRYPVAKVGACMMAAGYVSLASTSWFLIGLLLVALGAGLARGNLPAQLGSTYARGDRRRSDAFQRYYSLICVGGFTGPLLAGLSTGTLGWAATCGFAAGSVTAGLLVYTAWMRQPRSRPSSRPAKQVPTTAHAGPDGLGLLFVWPVAVCFWIAQSQVWNVYNLWARDHVRLAVGHHQLPVSWLQAFDAACFVVLSPLAVLYWRARSRRGTEPSAVAKLAGGCLLFATALCLLAAGPFFEDPTGRVGLLVPIVFHVVANLGAVLFSPVSTELYASASSSGARGRLVGANYAAIFVAVLTSGGMAAWYDALPKPTFWLMHALIVGSAGLFLLSIRHRLESLLAI